MELNGGVILLLRIEGLFQKNMTIAAALFQAIYLNGI